MTAHTLSSEDQHCPVVIFACKTHYQSGTRFVITLEPS
jgi:hypothetical protein